MAPVTRGSKTPRIARGSRSGRNRSRGSGLSRRIFQSSRIQDFQEDAAIANAEEASIRDDQSEDDEIDFLSSSGEDDIAYSNDNGYDNLLRSLNTNRKKPQSPSKRRKISHEVQTSAPVFLAAENAPSRPDEGEKDTFKLDEPASSEDEVPDIDGKEGSEDEQDVHDPFETHLSELLDHTRSRLVSKIKSGEWVTGRSRCSSEWKVLYVSPPNEADGRKDSRAKILKFEETWIKKKLQNRALKNLLHTDGILEPFKMALFAYEDILFCDRNTSNSEKIRNLLAVHILNHVLKTRSKVIKNTARLARAADADDLELRDQGFTRPKILIMLPTRQSCAKFVDSVMKLYEPEQQENRKRFLEAYSKADDIGSADKPSDFQDLFTGNDDDLFRIGLKFTRKSVKLFSKFYNSDIILASPLGLRMSIGSEDSKKQDYDFLSSIEILVLDHADALLMQNWEHVEHIFEHLNLQPKEAHDCDFSRVRAWYLDANAKYLRQTVVLSSFNTPELNALFGQHMLNIEGKVKISKQSYQGVIEDFPVSVKQRFQKFESKAPSSEPDARFSFFTTSVMPSITRFRMESPQGGLGILIFIPSYMDFVRVRNFFANASEANAFSFGAISEYTSVPDVARARSHFITGRHSVLLYTGRAHHFRRYRIRGVKRVVMYALPDNPIFYQEVASGFLGRSFAEARIDPANAVVRSIFSKWDILKLERIVGTQRVSTLLDEDGDTFDFT